MGLRQFFKRRHGEQLEVHEQDSKRVVLEELFHDVYRDRKRIYKVNFVRGLMFGAGSALGGALVLALVVWILALFVNIPLVGELFKNAQQSIERTTEPNQPSN